jgi:TetR/AcrR family transcriptional regulator, transcriptional repressor for nem operon
LDSAQRLNRDSNLVLGIEMMVEARFADADFFGDILKTKTVETARLEAYFKVFRQIHGKGERMCPGGSFAPVFGAVSSPVQAALHRFSKMHLDWLEDVVRDGVELGQFNVGDQRPRDVAAQILAAVQGALLVGRLTSDRHVLSVVAEGIRRYLGYVPKGAN